MKKTNISKYISISCSVLSLACLLLVPSAGGAVTAFFIAFIAGLIVMFNPHKSGGIFVFALLLCAVAKGFAIDYPFVKFPAALVSFLLVAFIYSMRNFFYRQMLVSRAPWMEPVATTAVMIFFVAVACSIHYEWRQWIALTSLCVFWIGSFVIYKDRNDVRLAIKSKNLEVKTGTKAPDFNLPDQNGNMITLGELLKKNHVLLIFVRGDWCPTCHMMLRSYFRNKEKFAGKNVRVVGIGPDPQGVNKEIMQRIDENSFLLSDDNLDTALLYSSDLQPTNPLNKSVFEKGVPLPASFLVHQNGKIAFTSRGDKAGEILQPELIFEVLKTFPD